MSLGVDVSNKPFKRRLLAMWPTILDWRGRWRETPVLQIAALSCVGVFSALILF